MAMYLDGISTFNDALGGVTVTLEDDFSQLDPEMVKRQNDPPSGKAGRNIRPQSAVMCLTAQMP